ncbi:MAG: hypothetical protein HOI23_12895 [Deltaproteobacteria bacterium]|jgi:hypothetical protein|nr:hypothetical protein [Deltaproteobacteria bacterium]MBT6434726.1 hypothetical protein [Deltaproteobacteria bacterium]MBT6489432.1 hypothetical protein [Deltaproteobacteria bacterium]
MFLRFSLVVTIVVSLVGCGTNRVTPGSDTTGDEPTGTEVVNLEGVVVETFLADATIHAGEPAQVTCIVSRDREQLTDIPIAVVVSPMVESITVSGVSASFTPTQAGEFSVQCMTAGREVADSQGATLTVTPADIVRIETSVSDNTLVSGVPGAVGCVAHDEYDNEIIDIAALENGNLLNLDHAVELIIEPPLGLDFVVRGTLVGEYDIACRFGEVVDPTPETIVVRAGLPAFSHTTLSTGEALPTDPVAVSCEVTDTYGNLLEGYDTVVSVLAADGTTASQNGALVTDHNVSAVITGDYYVFCSVPGYFAGDESPSIVKIKGGLPFSWNVDLLDYDCFMQGLELPIEVTVLDRWGNLIAEPILDVSVTPSSGVVGTLDGGLIFNEEGDYDITVGLQGDLDPFALISPFYANIRVDSTPPEVAITSPVRGAMLVEGSEEDTLVTITGTVTDSLSKLEEVRIDGRKLDVSGTSLTEAFEAEHSSRWGLSVFETSATDACGNKKVAQQSFLRSPNYAAASTEADSEAIVLDGMIVRLNQMAIDDEYRQDVDDLATLVQTIFGDFTLDSALPGTLVFSPENANDGSDQLQTATYTCSGETVTQEVTGFWVKKIGALQHGDPTLEHLTAVEDALGFGFSMESLVLPLEIHASLDMGCGGQIVETITGEVRIGFIGADGEGSIGFDGAAPTVSVCETCLAIDFNNVVFDFNWGSLSFMDEMINELLTNLATAVEDPVEALLGAQIRALVPDLLGSVLGGLSLGTGFDIPEPIGMTLNIYSGMSGADFSGPAGAGYGTLGLYTQVYPSERGDGIPATSLGAIVRSNEAPAFGPNYPVGVGLSDNTLNQIMWSIWYGGAFEIPDIVGLVPTANINGVELGMSAGLPPVVMPGRNGNDIEIGIGDMELTASLNLADALGVETPAAQEIDVRLYLSAVMGASFDYDPVNHAIQISIDGDPTIAVEVVEISQSAYQAEISQLMSSIMALVIPELLESVLSSFPIPEFDLGGLAGLDSNASWTIGDVTIARKNDYIRMTGSLQ